MPNERANSPETMDAALTEAVGLYRASIPPAWDVPAHAAVAMSDGRIVASTDPSGTASLARTIRSVAEYFDGDWSVDDVAITNDVFAGSCHASEFTAVAPLGAAAVAGWCAVRTEVADIGGWSLGARAPQALDIWSEGARITPVKLSTSAGLRREVTQIVTLNSRTPGLNDSCMRAIHAAAAHLTASSVLGAPKSEHPRASPASALRALAGREWRAAVSLPMPFGEPAAIRVETELRVRDGNLAVCFPNPPPASPFPVNATRWMTADAANRAIAASLQLEPREAIALSACTDVEIEEGGLLAARWPASVGFGRAIAGRAVFSAVLEALAPVARSADFETLWRDRGAYPGDRFIDWRRLTLSAERRGMIEAIESGLKP